MVNPLRFILDLFRRTRAPLPPGNYTAKIRDVAVDEKTGKISITYGNVQPTTTPQPPRGTMRRYTRRKE